MDKSYYHAHESAYKEIKTKGFVGWGNAKTLNDLGDAVTKQYLQETVEKYFTNPQGKTALDVGCGTGTTAFMLAQMGMDVTGIDISETAIGMGQDLSRAQNLNINFIAGDVLELEKLNQKFDLIYDSHCLHCIVFDEDRQKVLTGAKKSLNEGGIFVLDTMVMPNEPHNLKAGFEPLRFDDDYILWHKTKPSAMKGVVEINGQHWCAQRRIYPAHVVIAEVAKAGFVTVSHRLDAQDNEPSMLRLILR
ncbi:hypothetical protein CIK05_01195 [Bdellovibrio sp. qaytius]|nr:hypothetical protein CIK05_01195 [Bdellovibrio sp. qaytius]